MEQSVIGVEIVQHSLALYCTFEAPGLNKYKVCTLVEKLVNLTRSDNGKFKCSNYFMLHMCLFCFISANYRRFAHTTHINLRHYSCW